MLERTSLYSIEIDPYKDIDFKALNKLSPSFYSVVWRTKSNRASENQAISVSHHLSRLGHPVVLHLAARSVNAQETLSILARLKNNNLRNILIIQGEENPQFQDKTDFKYASDLIAFIKSHHGDYFCIGIAGYPLDATLDSLKFKVKLGADFILTQLTFDYQTFEHFHKICKEHCINVPIIPGVYIINSLGSLTRMIKICGVPVPKAIRDIVIANRDNAAAVCNFGVYQCCQLVKQLLEDKYLQVNNVHFYSLNNINLVEEVCRQLGLCGCEIERPLHSRGASKILRTLNNNTM